LRLAISTRIFSGRPAAVLIRRRWRRWLWRWRPLGFLAGAELFHLLSDLPCGIGTEIQMLPDRPVTLQIDHQLVLARRDVQPLEGSIEFVHGSGQIAVDVDHGFS